MSRQQATYLAYIAIGSALMVAGVVLADCGQVI